MRRKQPYCTYVYKKWVLLLKPKYMEDAWNVGQLVQFRQVKTLWEHTGWAGDPHR